MLGIEAETNFQSIEPSEMIVWRGIKAKGDDIVVARINTGLNTGKQILVAREKGHEILGIVTISTDDSMSWVNPPPPDVRGVLELKLKNLYSEH